MLKNRLLFSIFMLLGGYALSIHSMDRLYELPRAIPFEDKVSAYAARILQEIAEYPVQDKEQRLDHFFTGELFDAIKLYKPDHAEWILEQRPRIILQKPPAGNFDSWIDMALVYAKKAEDVGDIDNANNGDSIVFLLIGHLHNFPHHTPAKSPLISACIHERYGVIKWLLDQGYSITAKSPQDIQSPLDWAKDHHNTNGCALLILTQHSKMQGAAINKLSRQLQNTPHQPNSQPTDTNTSLRTSSLPTFWLAGIALTVIIAYIGKRLYDRHYQEKHEQETEDEKDSNDDLHPSFDAYRTNS